MRIFLTVLIVGLLSSASAFAAPVCYSPQELEAEHLLRLHTELMVVTVTCHQGSQGEDLVGAYTGFTKQHIVALHGAEMTMTHYFNTHGGDGENRLDRLRTRLGNEFGQKIVTMGSAQAFCDAFRDKVLVFHHATPADVATEVRRMDAAEKSYVEPCATAVHVLKDVGK